MADVDNMLTEMPKENSSKSEDTILDKEKSKKCGVCEKIYCNVGTLNRHMKSVHGGEKTHICDECPARYSRREDLDNHLKKGKHYEDGTCHYCKEFIVFKSEAGWGKHFRREPKDFEYPSPSRTGNKTCVNKLKKQLEQFKAQKEEFLLGSTTCVHCNEVIPNKNADKHWLHTDVEAPDKSTCMTNLERRKSMTCWYCKGEIITQDYIEQLHGKELHRFKKHLENPRNPSSCIESLNRGLEELLKKEKEIKIKHEYRFKKKGLMKENGEYVNDKMKCYEEMKIMRYNW